MGDREMPRGMVKEDPKKKRHQDVLSSLPTMRQDYTITREGVDKKTGNAVYSIALAKSVPLETAAKVLKALAWDIPISPILAGKLIVDGGGSNTYAGANRALGVMCLTVGMSSGLGAYVVIKIAVPSTYSQRFTETLTSLMWEAKSARSKDGSAWIRKSGIPARDVEQAAFSFDDKKMVETAEQKFRTLLSRMKPGDVVSAETVADIQLSSLYEGLSTERKAQVGEYKQFKKMMMDSGVTLGRELGASKLLGRETLTLAEKFKESALGKSKFGPSIGKAARFLKYWYIAALGCATMYYAGKYLGESEPRF